MTCLIVGAGTAGSTLAALMAMEGRPVALIGPPPAAGSMRIGESLPGFAANWLKDRALPGPLAAGSPHWAIPGSVTAWNGQVVAKSHMSEPWGVHYRLDRSAFDRGLYDAALEAGAKAYPHAATAVLKAERGWRILLANRETLVGDRLVDATGRRAWATRGVGRKREAEEALIAVWAVGAESTRKDRRTVTETVTEGWWYACLLPGGRPLACLHCHERIARLLLQGTISWRHLLRATRCVQSIVDPDDFSDATLETSDARGMFRRPVAGGDWIAIGDAAVTFDPVAAHGISFALFSADAARAWIGDGQGEAYAAFCEDQWRAYRDGKSALTAAEFISAL